MTMRLLSVFDRFRVAAVNKVRRGRKLNTIWSKILSFQHEINMPLDVHFVHFILSTHLCWLWPQPMLVSAHQRLDGHGDTAKVPSVFSWEVRAGAWWNVCLVQAGRTHRVGGIPQSL